MRKNFLLLAITMIWAGFAFGQTSGGPDAYGYTWANSNDPSGPTYSWIDITTTGNEVSGLADDNVVGPIDMGIDFQFYWIKRNQVYIGSNGYVAFQNINIASTAVGFPATPTADGLDEYVAMFNCDLSFAGAGNTGKVYTLSDVPNNRFIVSYHDVPFWTNNAAGFDGLNTFQVIFDGNDSSIVVQYADQQGNWNASYDNSPNPGVVGIENVSGSIGLMVTNNQYPVAGTAVRFDAPAVGLIDVHDVEPSVVQNDDNGGFFAITQGGNFFFNSTIGNVGNIDITTDITVNATVRDTNNNLLYTDNATITAPFAQGATENITFAIPFSPPLSGPYSLSVTTTNGQDINSVNNTKTVEVVAVDTAGGEATFSFASDNLSNINGSINWTGGSGNSGAGVYHEPYGYPILINAIEVFISNFVGFTPNPNDVMCRISLYDDDPVGGAVPGPLLFSHDVLGSEAVLGAPGGWTRIDLPSPAVITDGGYYLGYLQISDSVVCMTETASPISRRSYEILDNTWAVYRNNNVEDIWIRAVADVSNAVQSTAIEEEINGVTDFNVYPNPTTGRFTMDLSLEERTNVTIRIYDMQGRKMYLDNAINVTEFSKELDLSNYASGMYMIQVETPYGQAAERLVIH